MRRVIVVLVAVFYVSSGFSQSAKPNVVLIYLDDMGYGDIEPNGLTGIATPNFNKLAAEGLRLTNFNVAQAICSASRAALLTGCYPNRIGMSGVLMPGAERALNLEEETIAKLLKSNGYTTGMLGKWHLGSTYPFFPMQYGFDSFYGLPYSHDMWPVDYAGEMVTSSDHERSNWPPLPVIEGNKQIRSITTLEEQGQWTTTLTQRAISFISENKSKPFFLYLAHPLPHVPLAVSERFKNKSGAGLFGDVIMELDWSLGEIMNALESQGISQNTILIVTSDNGPWKHFGDHAGSTAGLREAKGTPFEGGTRVPFIIRWPGRIKAGNVSGELLTNMDILPTLCVITGSKLPARKIDGVDCSEFLLGKTSKSPRNTFYYYFYDDQLMAVRYKTWKLVLPHQSQAYTLGTMGKGGFPGESKKGNPVGLGLYNLLNDPGESYNVAALYPEVVKQILVYVEEARADLGDGLTKRTGKNLRQPAKVGP